LQAASALRDEVRSRPQSNAASLCGWQLLSRARLQLSIFHSIQSAAHLELADCIPQQTEFHEKRLGNFFRTNSGDAPFSSRECGADGAQKTRRMAASARDGIGDNAANGDSFELWI